MLLVHEVSPTLYRGPRPEFEDFYQLRALGVTRVVSLERGWFEWIHGELNDEVVNCTRFGMTPMHIQLGDVFPPIPTQIWAAYSLIASSEKTYVHCLHGEDRTGLVCAYYRFKAQHWSLSKALDEMYALGFHKFPYKYLDWVGALKRALPSR